MFSKIFFNVPKKKFFYMFQLLFNIERSRSSTSFPQQTCLPSQQDLTSELRSSIRGGLQRSQDVSVVLQTVMNVRRTVRVLSPVEQQRLVVFHQGRHKTSLLLPFVANPVPQIVFVHSVKSVPGKQKLWHSPLSAGYREICTDNCPCVNQICVSCLIFFSDISV